MLTNNFRPLISFYSGSSFKNVLGDSVAKTSFLGGHGLNGKTSEYSTGTSGSWATTGAQYRTWVGNGHEYRGSTLSYNYTTTTGTNSYTEEKTTYNWRGVVSSNECTSGSSMNISSAIYNGFVLFVGTGTTEPTAEDYCLDSAIELPVTGASCTHNSAEKTYVSRTFENNTESDITITEIGCYVFAVDVSTATTAYNNIPIVMIGREVLETPITIPAGEQRTFTFVIDLGSIQIN